MSPPGDQFEVRLLRLPVAVAGRTRQHHDELMREFELIAQSRKDEPAHEIPARLVTLVEELRATYSSVSSAQEAVMTHAGDAGEEEIPAVILHLPFQAGEATRHLGEMLDLADDYCAAGRHLLTLATPPESKRYRDWYLGEIMAQLEGQPPTPWPDFAG
jgi:hypothetical protein